MNDAEDAGIARSAGGTPPDPRHLSLCTSSMECKESQTTGGRTRSDLLNVVDSPMPGPRAGRNIQAVPCCWPKAEDAGVSEAEALIARNRLPLGSSFSRPRQATPNRLHQFTLIWTRNYLFMEARSQATVSVFRGCRRDNRSIISTLLAQMCMSCDGNARTGVTVRRDVALLCRP